MPPSRSGGRWRSCLRQLLGGGGLAGAGLWLLLGAACSPGGDSIEIRPLRYGPETASVEVLLGPGLIDGTLSVQLDGRPVTDRMIVGIGSARGEFELRPGPHLLLAEALFREGVWAAARRSQFKLLLTPPVMPRLLSSVPSAGASDVPRTQWVHLEFAQDLPADATSGVALVCDGERRPAHVHLLVPRGLVVNPDGELPAAAACAVVWRGNRGPERIAFHTAGVGLPAVVHYDRIGSAATAPFPDDFWLVSDPQSPGRRRLAIEFTGWPRQEQFLLDALVAGTRWLDGFSPVAHLTVELSEAPDPASLPHTPAESLDPLAAVGLFDVDPRSEAYGARVPFRLEVRSDAMDGETTHALLIYPSVSLEPGRRYGLVVTRGAWADPSRPFDPSLFFLYARDTQPTPGEPEALRRARKLAGDVLDALERAARPPIPRDDVALAVRFTVRSTDGIPDDLLAMRADVAAAPPPLVTIDRVRPEEPAERAAGSRVAAIVTGTWEAPEWRGPDLSLARDPATGLPVRTGTRPLGFVAALPDAAFEAPVPVTLYQHGNPGSAEEEVVNQARQGLAEAGFAVIGFTDTLNREVSPPGSGERERAEHQLVDLMLRVLLYHRVPDYFVETNGEQLAFLRAIRELGHYPLLAFDAPPEDLPPQIHGIDATLPLTYLGVSEGANLALSLLPYAPEIRAAALLVGGRRFSEVLIHQQAEVFLAQLEDVGFAGLSATDVWVALALLQMIFDDQDPHNHAPFLYRRPLDLGEGEEEGRASVLLVEGLNDSFVPNHATESLAWALGPIPQLEPVRSELPFAPTARAPLSGNVDRHTTAALYQYVPEGVPELAPTPGCQVPYLSEQSAREGHYCAQSSEESLGQRAVFFETALGDEAPTIIDPLSSG